MLLKVGVSSLSKSATGACHDDEEQRTTLGHGAPWRGSDAQVFQKRHHFPLFLSVEEVIEVLAIHKGCEIIRNGVVFAYY